MTGGLPIAIAVAGWAYAKADLIWVLGVVAGVYFAVAYWFAMQGGAARQRYMLGANTIDELIKGKKNARLIAAAQGLASVKANQDLTFKLANYIYGSQQSSIVGLVLIAVTFVVLVYRG